MLSVQTTARREARSGKQTSWLHTRQPGRAMYISTTAGSRVIKRCLLLRRDAGRLQAIWQTGGQLPSALHKISQARPLLHA